MEHTQLVVKSTIETRVELCLRGSLNEVDNILGSKVHFQYSVNGSQDVLDSKTVRSLMERPTQFSAKPLSAQGNYGDKYQACSSRVLHLSNSVEILPKVASGKEQPIIECFGLLR